MSSDVTSKNSATSAESDPHVVSPTVRKKLQQCYEHGSKLMHQDKYDYDYAYALLLECVVTDPGNSVYVDTFLQNLQRKFHNNKRGALLAFGGRGGLKKALAKKDWVEVLKVGPELLKSNPWDVIVLRGMAEACATFGYSEVELRYLKNALDANPKDPAVNKHCAQSLARIGQFDQAIVCWERVDEAKRGDVEAQKMISELQIAKTQAHGNMGKPDSIRKSGVAKPAKASPVEPSPASVPPPEAPKREIHLTPRQQLEQLLSSNPTDIESYLELARLHIEEDHLGDAAHVLTRALGASGNNIQIHERLEDVEILRKKQQLAIAEKQARSDASQANRELVTGLRDDLNRIELEVFDGRAQRHPTNLELKFQLGLRLKRAGNWREATKYFEQSQQLDERRTGAALEIGECLQRQKQYDKALKQYWVAAEEPSPERVEVKKLALYRLSVLAEGLKNLDDAQRALEALIALDPQYKDAVSRLDKIRSMRHKNA